MAFLLFLSFPPWGQFHGDSMTRHIPSVLSGICSEWLSTACQLPSLRLSPLFVPLPELRRLDGSPAENSYSAATKHTQETSPSEGVTVARSYRPRLRTDRPLSAASKPTEELYSAARYLILVDCAFATGLRGSGFVDIAEHTRAFRCHTGIASTLTSAVIRQAFRFSSASSA
jgi:hypothetical protein